MRFGTEVDIDLSVEDIIYYMSNTEKEEMKKLLGFIDPRDFNDDLLRDQGFIKEFVYSLVFTDSTELNYLIEQLRVNKVI